MKLSCPHCQRDIPADDIDIHTGLAKCAVCSAVFGVAHLVSGSHATGSKVSVSMPDRFSVSHDGIDLVIVRKWFAPAIFALLFFCVLWDGFLVAWYFLAFTQDGPLMMKLFPLIHVTVGVGLTYTAIAGFVNRSIIRANTSEISIRHTPLPWPGSKTLPRTDVDQLFCKEKESRGKHGTSYTYQLLAVMRGEERKKLLSGLESPEQVWFIEQELERYLGIRDRPVMGEVRSA